MPIASNHFLVILKVLENKNCCISEAGVSFSNLLEILENFTDLYGVWHLPQKMQELLLHLSLEVASFLDFRSLGYPALPAL